MKCLLVIVTPIPKCKSFLSEHELSFMPGLMTEILIDICGLYGKRVTILKVCFMLRRT